MCNRLYFIRPTENYRKQIQEWVNVLFDEEDVSFAQFDFIEKENGDIVPIDFSCRLGGGLENLMLSCFKENIYAFSLANELSSSCLKIE